MYDPTKDDYEYDSSLTADENRANLEARMNHLYEWARENPKSLHAAGCEARAQWLESCSYNDDDQLDVDENDGWQWVEAQLEDYAMVEILDTMVEKNSYSAQSGYSWMLDAVGYDIPGCMDYIYQYLENYDYHQEDKVKAVITKDYYDMWEEEDA